MNNGEYNPPEAEPRYGGQEIQPQFGIRRDELSREVRPYADNLKAQIWAVFAKYGISRPPHPNPLPPGEREPSTTSPPLTGGDQGEGVEVEPRFEGQRGSTSILDDLKAANPTTEDLEHLSDLLEQLDHIRKTGEPMERTKREYPHLYLETQLKEAREILGKENIIGPEEVAKVWFPSTLTLPSPLPATANGAGKGEGKVDLPFEIPPLPYSREDLEKAKGLGMFLILRISHDAEGNPLTASRMNELIQPRLKDQGQSRLLFNTDWYKDEPFFTQETPTTPSATQRPSPLEGRGQGEGGLPRAEWKLISKDILPDSTNKNYLDQTKFLRDTLASKGWLTPEEAAEVTDDKLEALCPLVDSNQETEWKEAARILSELKLNQNHRRTFSGALYDTTTFFLTRNERLLENRYDWTQTRSLGGDLVGLGLFVRDGSDVSRWDPGGWGGHMGAVLSR